VNFPILFYLVPFLTAFGTAFIALPFWERLCLRFGLVDDPGDRKHQEKPIPLAGGLTVMTALVMPTVLIVFALRLAEVYSNLTPAYYAARAAASMPPIPPESNSLSLAPILTNSLTLALEESNSFSLLPPGSNVFSLPAEGSNVVALTLSESNTFVMTPPDLGTISLMHMSHAESNVFHFLMSGLSQRGIQLMAVFVGAFAMLVLGLLDDRHELRASVKFTGQLLVTFLVAAAGVRLSLFVPHLAFKYAITILWILTVINAFNFVDNMNGLSAGLGVWGAAYFFVIAASNGQFLVALVASLMCGALLGFLPHNFPRATAFLGDSGSHLVGYLLAILAILPHFYTRSAAHPPAILAVLSPLLILAVPLADLTWVVIYRSLHGKWFFMPDHNHFSHQLVRRGFSRSQAVLLLWLAAAVLGALALIWN
jgi:UDP-N-acetylmuramyl pentapeptide phosphotransferase/UDP-N-acetylglucosamine-1-phosphate transferase